LIVLLSEAGIKREVLWRADGELGEVRAARIDQLLIRNLARD
jgi:hypothetical protein